MNPSGFIATGLGCMLGCCLRAILGSLLNHAFPHLPPGTLAANWLAGLLMGCLMGVFERFQTLPAALRLFAVTGFLGGLSTYSTFSAEANTLLLDGQYMWFGLHVAAHLVGTLSLTLLGIFITRRILAARTSAKRRQIP
jgi:CrcB protein